ncbi:MAG: hypothetical protein HUU06_10950, partial [Planctomycetaceae bacterium]|nr:hypothetical protein [Planctomycetaceae bacterium]
MSTHPECIHVVQGEIRDGGVVQAMVVARTRALARLPGMPRFRILFLEPWGTARLPAAREALAAHRALWPEGRMDLVPFVSRMGAGAGG